MPNRTSSWSKERGGVLLYRRIESLLKKKILSGHYEPGELLPREEDFAEQYSVSKITIRKALSLLDADGLIVRIPGKGTFVAEEMPLQEQFVVTGNVYKFVRDATRYVVKSLGVERIKIRDTRIPRELSDFLNLPREEEISIVKRVRLLDGEPFFYLENYIPTEVAKHLTSAELAEKPLLTILREKINLVIGRGEMYIEAVPAEPDVAEVLAAQVFEPLILMKTYFWFQSGEPFEIVSSFMRADQFKYKVNLDGLDF